MGEQAGGSGFESEWGDYDFHILVRIEHTLVNGNDNTQGRTLFC